MMRILFIIFVLLLAVATRLYFLEESSLFVPDRELVEKPDDIGLDYQDVRFTSLNGKRLHGWYVPADNARASVLFCHGNAGNIGDRLDRIRVLNAAGLNVFIFDYQGYGLSEGKPSEKKLYEDALAAYDFWKEHYWDGTPTFLFGASLGGAVAVNLATRRPFDGVILHATFTSAKDMARHYYPWIPSIFVRSQLDSRKLIAGVTAPKLFFHSPQDRVVPYDLGKQLYEVAPEPKRFVQTGGDHVDAHLADPVVFGNSIDRFVEDVLATLR